MYFSAQSKAYQLVELVNSLSFYSKNELEVISQQLNNMDNLDKEIITCCGSILDVIANMKE